MLVAGCGARTVLTGVGGLAVALPPGPAFPRIGGVDRARGEDAGLLDAGNRLQVGDSLLRPEGLFPDAARRALVEPFLSELRCRGVRLLGEGVLQARELTVGSRSRTGLSFSTKVSRRGLGFTRRDPRLSPALSRSCRAHCSSWAASLLASWRISSSFSGLRGPKLSLTPWGAGATAFRSLRWERPRRSGFSGVANAAMSSSSRLRQKTRHHARTKESRRQGLCAMEPEHPPNTHTHTTVLRSMLASG